MENNGKYHFNSQLYQDILNQLHVNVCVADMETNRLVYVNEHMKKALSVENPEGMICYELLEKNQKGKCSFCPQNALIRGETVDSWIDHNAVTERIYQNYDSLIQFEGKAYHLQQSVDITDLIQLEEEARTDELTGMFNRRAGKEKLWHMIQQGRTEKKMLAVVLYDVNELKVVNDQYGHEEGDRLLCYIANHVNAGLRKEDLFFRLSGDEFVVAFYDEKFSEAENRMLQIRERMEEERLRGEILYDSFFSFGITEVFPEEKCSLMDVIARADEKMYVQKRSYRIEKAKRAEKAEKQSDDGEWFEYDKEHLLEALRESTDDYIFIGNMKTGTFRYSPKMAEEFRMPGDIVKNAAVLCSNIIHPHDRQEFLESNQEIADGRAEAHRIEYRAQNVHGEWVWLRCRGQMIRDEKGDPELFAGFITNLGRHEKADHVTGIYGRFAFEGDIKKYFADKETAKRIGIMVMDMDSFKNINDLYDRAFGDKILRITAQTIASLLPENAKIYRLDGDEFGIVILNGDEREYEQIYDSIHRRFQDQQDYNGRKYYCTLSAGYASYPEDADNYLDLVKLANYSLEHSKAFGKNRSTRFSRGILKEKENQLEMTEMLRECITRGFIGFSVYYQPQVDASTGELLGAEALARWQSDKFGPISPGVFIPLLEQNGLILQLGQWICDKAIEKCKEWSRVRPDFHMSINLSYRQLQEGNFVENLVRSLQKVDLDPQYITLELTETYLIKADAAVCERIEQIRKSGVLLAMDDFGVGYSSLYSLKSMPVDIVKIDKGFVKDIATDCFNATFIRSITELCHNVGRQVCLEGVEMEEEYHAVQGVGLDMIQGFYFGRPEAEEEFAQKWML